jgi:hypothetical protein
MSTRAERREAARETRHKEKKQLKLRVKVKGSLGKNATFEEADSLIAKLKDERTKAEFKKNMLQIMQRENAKFDNATDKEKELWIEEKKESNEKVEKVEELV